MAVHYIGLENVRIVPSFSKDVRTGLHELYCSNYREDERVSVTWKVLVARSIPEEGISLLRKAGFKVDVDEEDRVLSK